MNKGFILVLFFLEQIKKQQRKLLLTFKTLFLKINLRSANHTQ